MNRSLERKRTAAVAAVVGVAALLALALSGLAAAQAKDRNHDRIPDRWERKHKLSLKVDQARRDQDRDQLRNRAEFRAGTDPRNADSDGDGIADGDENAGTIASFDAATGKLTIALFGGDSLTGFVDEDTEVECGCGHSSSSEGEGGVVSVRASRDRGGDGPDHDIGDDHGHDGPNHDLGDDHGEDGPGHDVGDDHGGDGPSHHGRGDDACSAEDLVVGAAIQEAELRVEDGRALFEKIELGR